VEKGEMPLMIIRGFIAHVLGVLREDHGLGSQWADSYKSLPV
jgi:hypothetical protein